jgi:hypothetical protein
LNRRELEQRLENVVNTIRMSETELKRLREDKKQRILLLHPGELKNIGTRIRELEDQVEDNKLARGALEKELQEFKEKKEPEAARIRKRLAEELWPAALAEYAKLPRILAELQPVLEKISAFNNEMRTLAGQHETLIGDSISTPEIVIPQELYVAAKAKIVAIPKSLDVRLTTEREEQRVADVLKEQRPIVNKILERAGEKWPTCPACGNLMLAGKRGPNTPAYGMSDDGSMGFANFRCPKHGEQTRDIVFPARQQLSPSGQRIIEGPAPLQSAFAELPPNASHGLETPGLTDQHKGGETK